MQDDYPLTEAKNIQHSRSAKFNAHEHIRIAVWQDLFLCSCKNRNFCAVNIFLNKQKQTMKMKIATISHITVNVNICQYLQLERCSPLVTFFVAGNTPEFSNRKHVPCRR